MRMDESRYSVAEIIEMLGRKDLVANKEYQRGTGIWPSGPRSYFIDTILSGFPFPKIYFFEYLDRATRKTKRELVDGQQRISSVVSFVENRFALTSVSRNFAGKRFSDLEPEEQDTFLSYPISVDVIRNATRQEILEMFKRMNAYTLPLNDAEKRHSTYQGEFKWMINNFCTENAEFFAGFNILGSRNLVRMADAELVSELLLATEEGIISSSTKKLNEFYEKYEENLDAEDFFKEVLIEFIDFYSELLADYRDTFLSKPYVVHSLFCATFHNKYGLPNFEEQTGLAPTGSLCNSKERALPILLEMAYAHENKDERRFSDYVKACSGGTNRAPNRFVRTRQLALALRS
ncbi:DUF262 domain-containing protein [Pseudomonas sp. fls2-241-TYG-175]|uniref:DUF262 domain-containing protein n=1 Tax=Pseudomonas sp. fls2-241-TYG-175 TaxID=3040312 RepID=UPI0025534194|nr:DUF262 domain-containing protein [Pseudomonas sp. fls2-241-TYG-175]